ncbi:DUF805 domain-containing protein, partial [Ilumatobacter sp.]|nr:DUF805 domain-containing protein [Ilumatobacter sp.]
MVQGDGRPPRGLIRHPTDNLLVNFLIALALGILASQSAIFGLLYVVYALGAFLPSLAIAVRRLHDTGKSGW